MLVLLLVFIAAAAGVANTMLMATFERTREFGMLLALGTHPARIVRLVIAESIALGVIGALAGSAIGVALVAVTHQTGHRLRGAGRWRAERAVVCRAALVAALLSQRSASSMWRARLAAVCITSLAGLGLAGAARQPAAAGRGVERRRDGRRLDVRRSEPAAQSRGARALSIVGIGIGCALALFMESLNRGRDELFARMGAYGGAGHVRIVPAGWRERRDPRLRLADWKADVDGARALPGVAAVTYRARAQALVAMGTHVVPVEIVGVDPDTEPSTYRFVRDDAAQAAICARRTAETVVIGQAIADRLVAGLDDEILATAVGQERRHREHAAPDRRHREHGQRRDRRDDLPGRARRRRAADRAARRR